MPFSTYSDNKTLELLSGKTAFTTPTAYIGLSTTTPTAAGGNVTEPATGAYARVATSGATWGSATAGSINNATAITFPTSTASWGSVTYVVVYDASTAGNMLWFAALSGGAQSVPSGVTVSIAAGQAVLSVA